MSDMQKQEIINPYELGKEAKLKKQRKFKITEGGVLCNF